MLKIGDKVQAGSSTGIIEKVVGHKEFTVRLTNGTLMGATERSLKLIEAAPEKEGVVETVSRSVEADEDETGEEVLSDALTGDSDPEDDSEA